MKKTFKRLLVIALLCAIAAFGFAASGETVVYITKTGERYHKGSCASLRSSKIEITLEAAVAKGFSPCGRCNPPVLDIEE